VYTQRRKTRLELVFGKCILHLDSIGISVGRIADESMPARTTRHGHAVCLGNLSSNCLLPASRSCSDAQLILPILAPKCPVVCLQLQALAQALDPSLRYSPLRILECSHYYQRMAETPMTLERRVSRYFVESWNLRECWK
jgi:hypothetical protein